jgi:putative endonuclease
MLRWIRNLLKRQRGTDNLGAHGEDLAARFLMKQGYRILDRNLKLVDDEADLVAIDPDGRTVVIVEVKTRRNDTIAPEWSIHHSKQAHMARLASRLQRRSLYRDRPFRFDAIAVIVSNEHTEPAAEPVIRHHVAAFTSPW